MSSREPPRNGYGSAGSDADEAALTLLATIFYIIVALVVVSCLLLWLAGQLSGVLDGNGWPQSSPGDAFKIAFRVVGNPGSPARAWPLAAASAVGPAWLVYALLLVFLAGEAYLIYRLVRMLLNWRRHRAFRRLRLGFAAGNEIREMLSAQTVTGKASSVRPSLKGSKAINPEEVGFFLGRDIRSRQKLYGSIEDVFIVLAPPRQGKDVHFCAPYTIDAPGPCIVTSTRADAFSNTYGMRARIGKVLVFDPNGLTNWPQKLRWSPIKGSEDPLIAANRAAAFIAGAGFSMTGDRAFYVAVSISVFRIYLHAAALGQKTLRDVMRWASQSGDWEPVEILKLAEANGVGAPGWADELAGLVQLDEQARGRRWSTLVQALTCFAAPEVQEACSPGPTEAFDLREFLAGRNTLYILGKEQKNGSVSAIVTAMLEDMFDEIRKVASRKPSSRLDPPLTIELNEAAHIAPLPNLPAYMGDSGGFSIALHVYLQSLSQARARWGENEAMIMWDNAAIRIIMGGAGNVQDLEDVSRLMGRVPKTGDEVLSLEEVRTLKFGTAIVVARAARPVEIQLTPWWNRKDGAEIGKNKAETERLILEYGEVAQEERARRLARATAPRPAGAIPGNVTRLRNPGGGWAAQQPPPAGGQYPPPRGDVVQPPPGLERPPGAGSAS